MKVRLQDGEVCLLQDAGERVISSNSVATCSATWFVYPFLAATSYAPIVNVSAHPIWIGLYCKSVAIKKRGKGAITTAQYEGDEATRRRVYRNTLVNVLTDAAKRLTYGKERESIMKKISELSQKGYAVITIKDGERTGQKIDNFTLRAEHIALRIFNRGVSAISHTRFLLFFGCDRIG